MKPYVGEPKKISDKRTKRSTQEHSQRKSMCWNFMPFPDKTSRFSSRPTAKRVIRNANRAQKKSARQRLKKDTENHE